MGSISGDREGCGGRLLFEGEFVMNKFLMERFERDRKVTGTDGVDNGFVGFIVKAL